MKSKSVLKAAGALAVAAGVVLGAGSWVQATESVGLQIATAEQTAAVKQRQELMKSIGGNAKAITEYLKASKGNKEEADAAAPKIGELAHDILEALKVEASLSERDAVRTNRGQHVIARDREEDRRGVGRDRGDK